MLQMIKNNIVESNIFIIKHVDNPKYVLLKYMNNSIFYYVDDESDMLTNTSLQLFKNIKIQFLIFLKSI